MVFELKTLEKKDPQFMNYLLGTFSKQYCAIPVTSLNVSTESESVTFELKPVGSILAPPFFKKWFQIFKIQNLIFAMLPIFLILMKNRLDQNDVDYPLAFFSGLGAIFLLLAVSLRNDVRDHISGLDRIQPKSGSRGIQEGWISAAQVQSISYVLFAVGALCGVPSMVVFPRLTIIVAGLALIAILAMTKYPAGLKYRTGTEFAVFFLLGPLLTLGYEMAIGGQFDIETISFGIIMGWFAVFIFHLKNFDSILISNQAGFENSMTKIGFEKGKRLLARWWIGFVMLINIYHIFLATHVWSFVFLFISVSLSWVLLKTLDKVKSPVASNFTVAIQKMKSIGFILIGLWVIENLAYLLAIEIGS